MLKYSLPRHFHCMMLPKCRFKFNFLTASMCSKALEELLMQTLPILLSLLIYPL